MKRTIYFDHNATTPVHPAVLKEMEPFYKDEFGNASSLHAKGRSARAAIDKSRSKISSFLGTSPEDIIFTSGGTESDNIAIKAVCWANANKGNHIVTSSAEHSAVLITCKFIEKKR